MSLCKNFRLMLLIAVIVSAIGLTNGHVLDCGTQDSAVDIGGASPTHPTVFSTFYEALAANDASGWQQALLSETFNGCICDSDCGEGCVRYVSPWREGYQANIVLTLTGWTIEFDHPNDYGTVTLGCTACLE
jgi:hypothetical protein